jgi:hypothetical protein
VTLGGARGSIRLELGGNPSEVANNRAVISAV